MILVSQSPRRKDILTAAGYQFKIVNADIDEIYPSSMAIIDIPAYLALEKANSVKMNYPGELLLAADTIVVLEGQIIGKPINDEDAIRMLSGLSGKKHTVITGVCILKGNEVKCFSDISDVYFAKLTQNEIRHYVAQHKPLDKAGAYGVQDWIGMIAIESIRGSYYNVMGFPIHKVYRELKQFGLFPEPLQNEIF